MINGLDIPSISDTAPVRAIVAVTPSDTVDLANGACRGLHVNVAGDVTLMDFTGATVMVTLPAGGPYPYAAKRILSTGTSATGIRALY